MPRILVVDNYDSFVYILVQYLGSLGAEPVVLRNDAVTLSDIEQQAPDGILLSPGPGTPDDAGICLEVIDRFSGRFPIFGVCLGAQCIGQAFGAEVVQAPQLMHGKTSLVDHDGLGVFAGVPNPLEATRYHSLVVDPDSLPTELELSARCDDETIMGLRHRDHPTEGVQFHPESVFTKGGQKLVENFLATCR